MDKEFARRAHTILMKALDVDPSERASLIATECTGDERLRAHVTDLVKAIDQSSDFLETPVLEGWTDEATSPVPRIERIGNYRIVGVIGVGGMATVYEAIQEQPERRVALKVMRQGLAQTSAIHRFQYETEILARLQHPGIAQIFEVGTWSDDHGVATPYFTMEYISDARTITEYASERSLSRVAQLQMFAGVCDAVQHGHQNGIIHRDLKPGNILVDSSGHPKVIDFGVARSVDPDQAWITKHADFQHLIGTLNYMSPEQCASGVPIDIRSDVYSLGVVLYELVCGRLPHDFSSVPLPEALHIVRNQDPPRPSAIDPHLRGDIDAIVTMAIDKDPDRRYRSAVALGADICRHLNHQTVEARPPTLLYQCQLFARRNRALVTAITVVALTIIAGAIISARFGYQATRESERRRAAEIKAVEERDAALWKSYVASMAAAFAAYQTGEIQQVRTRLASVPADLRNWEWRFLRSLSERSLYTVPAHDDMVFDLAATMDGRRLVTGGRDGVVHIWDAESRSCLARFDATDGGPVYAVSISLDERLVASASEDGAIRIWDAQTGARLHLIHAYDQRVSDVSFGRDNLLASTSDAGVARLWDGNTGTLLAAIDDSEGAVQGLVFFDDGSALVTWNDKGQVCLRSADGARVQQRFAFDEVVVCAATTRDHTLLAVGGANGRVNVWKVGTGEIVYELQMPSTLSGVRALAFSRSGDRLAAGQSDRRIHLLSMVDARLIESLSGHEEAVSGLSFSAEDRTLNSISWDRTWRVWGLDNSTRTDFVRELSGHQDYIRSVAFSPDSRLLASGANDHTIRLWEPELGRSVGVLRGHEAAVSCVAFAPDGASIASGSYDRTVRIWNAKTGELETTLGGHDGHVWSIAYSPDGSLLASAGEERIIRVWDIERREVIHSLTGHSARINHIAYSPDGTRIASASRDHTVRVWDEESERLLWKLDGHTSDVFAVVFSHDNGRLYSGSRDQSVRVWDMRTGDCLDTLSGHGQFVTSLTLSPDGTRLAAGSWFGEVVIWDLAMHDVVASIKAHRSAIRSVAFSPNGRWLAACAYNKLIRLFDASPSAERLQTQTYTAAHYSAAKSIVDKLSKRFDSIDQIRNQIETDSEFDSETRFWLRLLLMEKALDQTDQQLNSPLLRQSDE